ncbi:DUF1801 domain-containing protein [Candidatus Peregrinibacteria bacterium]|nr:MAG: DUF1801 domain-containing protein [Candidatus Peregrinibacteria bacterium]
MAELKTKKTKASVSAFLAAVEDEKKRKDCQELAKIFEEITEEKPAMWGDSIVGFGSYHYKSERSKQEGDWPLTGFSPRKKNITLYIMCGFKDQEKFLKKIGKHKVSGGSCLYIKHLSDIDLGILKELIKASLKVMKERYKLAVL